MNKLRNQFCTRKSNNYLRYSMVENTNESVYTLCTELGRIMRLKVEGCWLGMQEKTESTHDI